MSTLFGGKADGNESMKNLLGGKGANLAEMAGHPKLRLPVPQGFTITTEVCTFTTTIRKPIPGAANPDETGSREWKKQTGKLFGDEKKNPLLVSVRSAPANPCRG